MKFLIIAAGYNCQDYVKACIDSVKAQTYKDWKLYVISDGSTDKTANIARKNNGKNIFVGHGFKNMGACFRRYEAIMHSKCDPETVVVLLGLDDELKPHALERIKEEYDKGALCTYGNWENQHGAICPLDINFPESTHKNRSYRGKVWLSTAPNTFKKKLFDKIPVDRLKVHGQFPKSDTESETMFACLEMSGKERIGVIHEPIYIYNQRGSSNARNRLGSAYQDNIYNTVIKRPKFNLYEEQ